MGTVSGIGGPPIALAYSGPTAPPSAARSPATSWSGNLVAIPTLIVAGQLGGDELVPCAGARPGRRRWASRRPAGSPATSTSAPPARSSSSCRRPPPSPSSCARFCRHVAWTTPGGAAGRVAPGAAVDPRAARRGARRRRATPGDAAAGALARRARRRPWTTSRRPPGPSSSPPRTSGWCPGSMKDFLERIYPWFEEVPEPPPRPALPAHQQGRLRRHRRGARRHPHPHRPPLEGGAPADRDRGLAHRRPPRPRPRAGRHARGRHRDRRLLTTALPPSDGDPPDSADARRRARRHRPRRHVLAHRRPRAGAGARRGGRARAARHPAARRHRPSAGVHPRPAGRGRAWPRRPSCSTAPSASTSPPASASTWRRTRPTRRWRPTTRFVSVGPQPGRLRRPPALRRVPQRRRRTPTPPTCRPSATRPAAAGARRALGGRRPPRRRGRAPVLGFSMIGVPFADAEAAVRRAAAASSRSTSTARSTSRGWRRSPRRPQDQSKWDGVLAFCARARHRQHEGPGRRRRPQRHRAAHQRRRPGRPEGRPPERPRAGHHGHPVRPGRRLGRDPRCSTGPGADARSTGRRLLACGVEQLPVIDVAPLVARRRATSARWPRRSTRRAASTGSSTSTGHGVTEDAAGPPRRGRARRSSRCPRPTRPRSPWPTAAGRGAGWFPFEGELTSGAPTARRASTSAPSCGPTTRRCGRARRCTAPTCSPRRCPSCAPPCSSTSTP